MVCSSFRGCIAFSGPSAADDELMELRQREHIHAVMTLAGEGLALPPDWAGAVEQALSDLEAFVELPRTACLRWPGR